MFRNCSGVPHEQSMWELAIPWHFSTRVDFGRVQTGSSTPELSQLCENVFYNCFQDMWSKYHSNLPNTTLIARNIFLEPCGHSFLISLERARSPTLQNLPRASLSVPKRRAFQRQSPYPYTWTWSNACISREALKQRSEKWRALFLKYCFPHSNGYACQTKRLRQTL